MGVGVGGGWAAAGVAGGESAFIGAGGTATEGLVSAVGTVFSDAGRMLAADKTGAGGVAMGASGNWVAGSFGAISVAGDEAISAS